jgi:hypothetical protein
MQLIFCLIAWISLPICSKGVIQIIRAQLFIFHEQAESYSFPWKNFFVFFSKKSGLTVFFLTIFDALDRFYTQKQRKKN